MCKLCENYNFGGVGFDFEMGKDLPTIYFPSHIGDVPEEERFKFCPACGEPLTAEHFKPPKERGVAANRTAAITPATKILENTPLDEFNKAVQKVMEDIRKASARGLRETCFNPTGGSKYYFPVKEKFMKYGYRFHNTGVIGGVMQDTEEICW